jgi:hypothetical protein
VIALNAAALRDAGVRNLYDLNQIAPNIEVQVLRMYGAELKYSFWRSDFCDRINSTNPLSGSSWQSGWRLRFPPAEYAAPG